MVHTAHLRTLRRHLVPLVAWTLLWALFFLTVLVGAEHLQPGDFSGQFHAFALFQAREFAQGRLPVWSPGSYGGIPFAADPQAAVYYPPRALTVLLSHPWGFPYFALEMEALLHVWLAGVFTYALAYHITRQPLAGLLAAVGFALGGYLTSYPLLQLAILETITWLPLALLLVRLGVTQPAPVPWLIGAGLILGVSALAGHPQTLLHVAYLVAAYYLFLALTHRWTWRWVLVMGALVAGVAIGVWSAALWPALQYLPFTSRSTVSYEFVSSGLPMLDYIQTIVPGVLSLWSPEYWGLASLMLAILAVRGRRQGNRGEVGFWAIAAVLSAWLALGDSGILFELVYRIAPGFSLFQRQERLLAVFSLSGSLLAAQGMALWLDEGVPARSDLVRHSACVAGGGLLLAGLILAVAGTSSSWPVIWARQAVMLGLVVALLWGRCWRRQRGWMLAVVLGADLYLSTLGAVGRQPGSPAAFWPQPGWVRMVQSAGPVRLDSSGLFYGNLGEVYGLEDIGGISPLRPSALEELKQLPQPRRWQLLNVGFVLASAPPADMPLTKVADVREAIEPGRPLEAALYRFDAALPRAWMSYSPVWVSDRAAALKLLADPGFDPAASVILEGAGSSGERMTPPQHGPGVHISRLDPSALEIDVTTEAAGYLVISEWFYPGWRARLDGKTVPIVRADYALQAVAVPAGTHRLLLRYEAPVNSRGLAVSLLSLVVAGILTWRWRPVTTYRALRTRVATSLAEPRPLALEGAAWLCAAAVLLGFGLRAGALGSQELRGDEAFSYLLARQPMAEILPAILRQGDPHSPLHYWLLHAWMRVAGDSELAMRFISFVPSVLLLPLLYRLGKKLSGRWLGLTLAGMGATSQSLVWIGQDLRNQYTLVTLFSLLAILELVEAMERPAWWRWALCGLLSGLSLYSHYYGAFALLGQGLAVLTVARCRKHWKAWAVSTAFAALTFLPWFLAMWPRLVAAGQLSAPDHPDLAAHLVAVGTELAVGIAFSAGLARWLFLGGLALSWLGLLELRVREPGWAVLLSSWVAAAALGTYLLRFTRSTFNAFYILVAAVPWWALVAAGLRRLWMDHRRWVRGIAALALLLLVGGNAVSLYNYYSDPRYSRSSGYRGLAQQIAAEAQPADIFVRNYPDPCYDYYLQDVPIPRTMEPLTAQATPDETERSLSDRAAQYARLWFVSARGSAWDPKGVASHWLEYNALLEQETRHGSLLLQAYRPLRIAERVIRPLNRSIEGLVCLRGAHVTINGQPANLGTDLTVPAGATLKVTLLWEALASTKDSYTVFVHLMGEDGRLLAQHDGIPIFGTSPTWSWRPGQQVLDRHDVVVPSNVGSGGAQLLVGMYHSDSLARLRWDGGADTVELATIDLQSAR